MTDMVLAISDGVLDALRREARSAGAHECCGALLADRDGVVVATRAVPNAASRPDRYAIPAAAVRALDAAAAEASLEVAGFYHSHPTGEATPSALDTALAWPGYVYTIVAQEEVRSWRLRDDRTGFEEVRMREAGR